jgi:NAD(P)-dependent dehydrogenase (short-subunit alcohol dehydrogenase family)
MTIFSLEGRVAVVTGALGLLGRHHCGALARAGATVVVTDLDPAGCMEMADRLAATHGFPAIGHGTDITAPASVHALCEAVLDRLGRVDVLVNNAALDEKVEDPGTGAPLTFEAYPLEEWERSLRVNVTGTFLCCQAFGAEMARQGRGFFKSAAYPTTKGAVLALTRYLAAYWGRSGVRVNALSPGGVENGQDPDFVTRYSERTPLGRMADPSDYEGAIVYLASDASAYVTGTNLVVDGGWTAW